MAPPGDAAVQVDHDSFHKLLDESHNFLTEGKKEEQEQEQQGKPSWTDRFSTNIKNGIGAITGDTFGEVLQEKLAQLKVRLSSQQEEDEEQEDNPSQYKGADRVASVKSSDDYIRVTTPQPGGIKPLGDKAQDNLRHNIIVKLMRRLQRALHNHSLALNYLQHIINKLEERVSKVEEKVEVTEDWVKKEVQDVVKEQVATLEVKVEKLEEKKEALELEVDETRQRGMKGNILITVARDKKHLLEPARVEGQRESTTTMCSRVMALSLGREVPEADIVACHPMGKQGLTYIVRIINRNPGSAWDTLQAGLATGGLNSRDSGVFLSFQLTPRRVKILDSVRDARKERLISKFRVDQNGRIAITHDRGVKGDYSKRLRWQEVTSLSSLSSLCGGVEFPRPRPERPREQQRQQ